jgi:hypothetical protein
VPIDPQTTPTSPTLNPSTTTTMTIQMNTTTFLTTTMPFALVGHFYFITIITTIITTTIVSWSSGICF